MAAVNRIGVPVVAGGLGRSGTDGDDLSAGYPRTSKDSQKLEGITAHHKWVAVGILLLTFVVGWCNGAATADAPKTEVSLSSATVPALKPAPLTPNYRYPDGLDLTITQITHAKLDGFRATDDPNAKPGDPYTIVTVTLRNGTHHEVEAAFQGLLRYGPRKPVAHRVNLNDNLGYVASLSPGELSAPYDMGFLIPANAHNDVILQVTVDIGRHQPATFVGSVHKA